MINNNNIYDNTLGYYKVNDKCFLNKYEALVAASKTSQPVTYHWYDEVFDKVDRTNLGLVSLDELYRRRAQQIRDEYDYIILNYSGGCDSWNILKTFIDNNIKLDQVMVCWPFKAGEAGLYVPNKQDKSASNFMSEWDFTTRPDLEWLSKNHPNIKIELIDWSLPFIENPSFVNESKFDQLNHFHNLADLARSTLFSNTERDLVEKGKKVCTIWGIDKPVLTFEKSTRNVYMAFRDSITTVGHPSPYNPHGTEFFYWSPKMPELIYEMSYRKAQWFKERPQYQKLMFPHPVGTFNFTYIQHTQMNQFAAREACYTTWNNKENTFQVNKPTDHLRKDKDFWLYDNKEFAGHVQKWEGMYGDYLGQIDTKYAATGGPEKDKQGYAYYPTMDHLVCTI